MQQLWMLCALSQQCLGRCWQRRNSSQISFQLTAALCTVQAGGATDPKDLELETRDPYLFLATQMQTEAGKSQAPLKQDVLKVFFCLSKAIFGRTVCPPCEVAHVHDLLEPACTAC